jgi:hypothetical protein
MDPGELTAFTAALGVLISNNTPDDNDLALIAIAVDLLSDNLDAIIAQRALMKNKEIIPLPVQDGGIL